MSMPKGSSAAWYTERREAGLCTSCDMPRLPSTSKCPACLKRPTPQQKQRTKLKARYGITLEQYNEMYEAQDGICPICLRRGTNAARERGPHGQKLVVDHCHTTSAVRGLVHATCNSAMGQLYDDPAVLRRAADFLEGKWRSSLTS